MNRILSIILCILTLSLGACAQTPAKAEDGGRTLVAYFSAQGHTKASAEKVAAATDGTLFEIQPVKPYTEEDLDGWNESARGTLESKDRTTRPGVANKVEKFAQYDTIYLGFPIWWFTAPTIINTFLESYDTEGKTIIPFATSGGSDYGDTEKDLRVSAPKAKFLPGKVLNDMDENAVKDWVRSKMQ